MSTVVGLFVCLACGGFFPAYVNWCTLCGAYGLVVVRGERPRSGIDDATETTTARALVARAWKRLVVAAYDITSARVRSSRSPAMPEWENRRSAYALPTRWRGPQS
jgi:hypothetical protein